MRHAHVRSAPATRVFGALLTCLLAVTLVVTVTIDLGYVFGGAIRSYAEAAGSRALERPLHLGRLGIQIC